MATEYCNLCTHVVAPSESIAALLRERGVMTPITAIPTGVDIAFYAGGDRARCLNELGVPADALVVGHVGRLAEEKNLDFLARAVGLYLGEHSRAVFVVVGAGDRADVMRDILLSRADERQVVMAGSRTGRDLADAYAAMDVFVFSSQSETQGIVLAEAMAAATPVVALDGPGVREVVSKNNGRLLPADATEAEFAAELDELSADPDRLRRLGKATQRSIADFSLDRCAERLASLYEQLMHEYGHRPEADPGPWDRLLARMEIEWKLVNEKTAALAAAVRKTPAAKFTPD
jgi:glycosyltransferase involved in cell wall biosynthesis